MSPDPDVVYCALCSRVLLVGGWVRGGRGGVVVVTPAHPLAERGPGPLFPSDSSGHENMEYRRAHPFNLARTALT